MPENVDSEHHSSLCHDSTRDDIFTASICLSQCTPVYRSHKSTTPDECKFWVQLGIEAVREEVLKVLKEDPTFHELQREIGGEQAGHARSSGLRRRLPASQVARSAGQDDPHADTWTEPSTEPGSPRNDPAAEETLDLCSEWDGSEFELLNGPNSSERGSLYTEAREPEDSEKESLGHRLSQWLQECSQSIARVVGGVCQGAVTLVKGIVNDCTKLMKDVASWCQRSIDELRRRGMYLFICQRWCS